MRVITRIDRRGERQMVGDLDDMQEKRPTKELKKKLTTHRRCPRMFSTKGERRVGTDQEEKGGRSDSMDR